jgi:hypothetical protein
LGHDARAARSSSLRFRLGHHATTKGKLVKRPGVLAYAQHEGGSVARGVLCDVVGGELSPARFHTPGIEERTSAPLTSLPLVSTTTTVTCRSPGGGGIDRRSSVTRP